MTVYVMTGKTVWKDMTRFWGKLFGINFAPGVTTGITREFQFGTNWAYDSHCVGDVFGAAVIFMPLIVLYTGWACRVMRGKVTVEHVRANEHTAY